MTKNFDGYCEVFIDRYAGASQTSGEGDGAESGKRNAVREL